MTSDQMRTPAQEALPQITPAQLFEEYLLARRAEGLRDTTLDMYRDALGLFGRFGRAGN